MKALTTSKMMMIVTSSNEAIKKARGIATDPILNQNCYTDPW